MMLIRCLAACTTLFAAAAAAAPEQVLQPQPVVIPTEQPPAVDPARLSAPPAAKAERGAPVRKAKAAKAGAPKARTNAKSKAKTRAR